MFKKSILFMHRILGTVLSVLFLVWFLSGFVMIYHKFPRVANRDRFSCMSALPDNLQDNLPSPESIRARFADSTILSLSLETYAEQTVFKLTSPAGTHIMPADAARQREIPRLSFAMLEQYARRWSKSNIARTDTLYELEQWIPFSALRKEFPIYKFYFGDEEKHQLYVSSQSGEPLQFTDKSSRLWAWLGAIPHWVYFTSLRQNRELWINTVILLSGLGCIMCLAGIIVGAWEYVRHYRRRGTLRTPYRKFTYKWHHIAGFIFGPFVFTFTFSGMMSLAEVPQWLVKEHDPSIREKLRAPAPVEPDSYRLDYRKILSAYPQRTKRIEWASFGDKPLYRTVVDSKQLAFDASTENMLPLSLNEDDVGDFLIRLHNDRTTITLMEEYDNYYVGLSDHLPLPVYKASVENADNSTYYINPKNGSIRYFNNNSKTRRWMYQALHSFKFKFAAERPILWNILVWTTMTGGSIVAATGVWLGFRYARRKLRIMNYKL